MPRLGARAMPVTELIADRIGRGRLGELVIVHINHYLDDIIALNEILLRLGARLVYVPILYGIKELPNELPYPVVYACQETNRFGLYRDFRRYADGPATFEEAVNAVIAQAHRIATTQVAPDDRQKVLIIEDGGYHFGAIQHLSGAGGPSIAGAIEQTVAGIRAAVRHLENGSCATYPVLSVARSKLKLRFENYFIARRVVEETALLLYELEEFLALGDVVVVGYGIIGRPIAALLRKLDCRVRVLEKNPHVARTAQWDGFELIDTVSQELFETSPLILGATGHTALTIEMLAAFLAGSSETLYLASASSKRVEFAVIINYFEGTDDNRAAVNERYPELASIREINILKASFGLSYAFSYHGATRRIVLLAEGYPINFYRPQSQSLPSKIIDPINAEILVLAHYLSDHHSRLDNRLYLLGHDDLPGLCAEEDEVMELWTSRNRVSSNLVNRGIWQALSPHPNERLLISPE